MEHRKYEDEFVRRPKVDCVGKSVQQRTANIVAHGRELEWSLSDASERTIDIAEKPL